MSDPAKAAGRFRQKYAKIECLNAIIWNDKKITYNGFFLFKYIR
ncbi:MAG: hypothetical protein ACTSWY_03155 [Promethearchaeota archaeon]